MSDSSITVRGALARADDGHRTRQRRRGEVGVLMLDQQPVSHQRRVQATLQERPPVVGANLLHLAVQCPVAPEDVAARVAERRRVDRRLAQRRGSSGPSVG